jgi:prefoldin subunit 5
LRYSLFASADGGVYVTTAAAAAVAAIESSRGKYYKNEQLMNKTLKDLVSCFSSA